MEEGEDGVGMKKRAEIDTRAPFRSVKEAVSLFGERVLAGELYANKLKQLNGGNGSENGHGLPWLGSITAELEETKQTLEKAREESIVMTHCLSSMQEELEATKRELEILKQNRLEKQVVKTVQDSSYKDGETRLASGSENGIEFEKKRYVRFANPPSLAQVVSKHEVEKLERHCSLKSKKKPLIPLIGGMFSKKKKDHQPTFSHFH